MCSLLVVFLDVFVEGFLFFRFDAVEVSVVLSAFTNRLLMQVAFSVIFHLFCWFS